MSIYRENPCKGCEKRSVGCHGTCAEHAEWAARVRDDKEKIYQEKSRERQLDKFSQDAARKRKKKAEKEL